MHAFPHEHRRSAVRCALAVVALVACVMVAVTALPASNAFAQGSSVDQYIEKVPSSSGTRFKDSGGGSAGARRDASGAGGNRSSASGATGGGSASGGTVSSGGSGVIPEGSDGGKDEKDRKRSDERKKKRDDDRDRAAAKDLGPPAAEGAAPVTDLDRAGLSRPQDESSGGGLLLALALVGLTAGALAGRHLARRNRGRPEA